MKRIGFQNYTVLIAFFIFLVMALSACALIRRGGDEEPAFTRFGNAEQLSDGAILVCSQACRERGFCGTTDSGDMVILANTQAPSTQAYNWFFVENTRVTITSVEPHIAKYQISQENEAVFYYKVANEAFEEAWVAGWCVGQQ